MRFHRKLCCMLDYRLPRVINHARNDKMERLPRKFFKFSRNDNNDIGSMRDGLPQPLTRLRNDASCVISFMRHYRLPRKFYKLARNDGGSDSASRKNEVERLPRFLVESRKDKGVWRSAYQA